MSEFTTSLISISAMVTGTTVLVYTLNFITWWLIAKIVNTFHVYRSLAIAFNLVMRKRAYLVIHKGLKGKELREELKKQIAELYVNN